MVEAYTYRRVTEATEKWLLSASEVLAEAFQYKFFAEALNNDKERILECLRAHLTAGLAEGEVYVAEDSDGKPIGLTLWFGPGYNFLATENQREAGWNKMIQKLAPDLQTWWREFLLEYHATGEQLYGPGVKLASYHLQLLGVHPDHQRKGVASHLMAIVHQKAGERGLRCLLETANPTNLPVYESLGYSIEGQATMHYVAGNTFPMWFFSRLRKST